MKSYIAVWTIAAGLLLSAAAAVAQDSTTTQQTTTTSSSDQNSAATQQASATPPDKDRAAAPSTSEASATATQDSASTDRSSDVRTLTGCLQKGGGDNEYRLTGEDGSTWELRSDAVDLAWHVGQKVTITGAVRNAAAHDLKEDTKREAQEHGMDEGATEHGHMTVTNLTRVSRSCS